MFCPCMRLALSTCFPQLPCVSQALMGAMLHTNPAQRITAKVWLFFYVACPFSTDDNMGRSAACQKSLIIRGSLVK